MIGNRALQLFFPISRFASWLCIRSLPIRIRERCGSISLAALRTSRHQVDDICRIVMTSSCIIIFLGLIQFLDNPSFEIKADKEDKAASWVPEVNKAPLSMVSYSLWSFFESLGRLWANCESVCWSRSVFRENLCWWKRKEHRRTSNRSNSSKHSDSTYHRSVLEGIKIE